MTNKPNEICPNSYSNEHSGVPIDKHTWRCVHCGFIGSTVYRDKENDI